MRLVCLGQRGSQRERELVEHAINKRVLGGRVEQDFKYVITGHTAALLASFIVPRFAAAQMSHCTRV